MTNSLTPPSLASVEWVGRVEPRPNISLVVFDFDGTLSWIRHGWPQIMKDMFLRHLPLLAGERRETLAGLLEDVIVSLNGKPTIFQMRGFVELAEKRGAKTPDAESLRAEFQEELDKAIERRIQKIREGQATVEDYLIHQALPLLQHLATKPVELIVLSSTVVERVKEEAEVLGIAEWFGGKIFGGVGDPLKFSKRAVFERLLQETGATGEQLLSFGDGPTEIRDTKQLGGLAIAVCTDETENGSGVCDAEKRRQLMAAGADVVMPDYRDAIAVVNYLLG